jgi:putative oxidoreductase
MKYVTIAVRILLGALFTFSGANYFLHFVPMPPPDQPDAHGYIVALDSSGYMAFVKVLEFAGGLLLVVGRFVPLGLVLLTPVIVNITLYEICLLHKPGPGGVALVLAVVLIVAYRKAFAPVFRPGTGHGDPA